MLFSGKQIVSKVRGHIKKRGGAPPAWVVGISADARKALFARHGVNRKTDRWILLHAESASIARKVKEYLMRKIGVAGGAQAEDDTAADFVYAYKRSLRTRP